MNIALDRVWHQEDNKRIVATITYSEQEPGGFHNSIRVEVALPWIDSYEEIKRQAFEKAKAFLLHVSADR